MQVDGRATCGVLCFHISIKRVVQFGLNVVALLDVVWKGLIRVQLPCRDRQ